MFIPILDQPPTFLYSDLQAELNLLRDTMGIYDYYLPSNTAVKEQTVIDYAAPSQIPKDLPLTARASITEPRVTFRELADQWKQATEDYSVIGKRYRHPAYKSILDMQHRAVPMILNELRREPDHWFAALEQLTGKNPARQAKTFYEAVDLWIAWGISEAIIS